jgi:hypothetical protein
MEVLMASFIVVDFGSTGMDDFSNVTVIRLVVQVKTTSSA